MKLHEQLASAVATDSLLKQWAQMFSITISEARLQIFSTGVVRLPTGYLVSNKEIIVADSGGGDVGNEDPIKFFQG